MNLLKNGCLGRKYIPIFFLSMMLQIAIIQFNIGMEWNSKLYTYGMKVPKKSQVAYF